MPEFLRELVQARKRGEARGLASICSAHPWVLRTALRGDAPVLIEATCNQVNQFGGYTGLTPSAFRSFVLDIVRENGFPPERLILGGDHLGPSPWQNLAAATAMQNAAGLVRDFVRAGFTKIHLDASMRLGGDDPDAPLSLELAARRTARLAKVAEESVVAAPPSYVIGTEVPLPGGAHADDAGLHITTVEQARSTLEATQVAYVEAGLGAAWERVIALVVQPGVEFGGDYVVDYDPAAAAGLARFAETIPFVYEAHSTDYQTPQNLQNLVRDHFAILKVGPALTFAFREAAFSLAAAEAELFPPEQRSGLVETLEAAMLEEPQYWQEHYSGSGPELAWMRKFGLSDRIRYYWGKPSVQVALSKLLQNFGEKPLPLALLSQYFHSLYWPVREGRLQNSAGSILTESISAVLRDYECACQPAPD
jgi:D-tagatose-1,6-bisphosphate aldolase subunit GatZ/KbaZ